MEAKGKVEEHPLEKTDTCKGQRVKLAANSSKCTENGRLIKERGERNIARNSLRENLRK